MTGPQAQLQKLVVEYRPLAGIVPYEKNARKIPQAAVDAVARSLREFGWQQPIVVDAAGVIIVGHVRRLAALQEGMTEAPVVVAAHLTAAQVRQYRLMDNRSHDEAKWDPDILTAELLDMRALDLDLSLTGFSSGELDRLLLQPTAGEDEVPPVPDAPISRLGDLWLCGDHRVLCGDATSAADVQRAMGGATADMVFTDPPYGVNFGVANHNPRAKRWARIENDNKAGDDFLDFLCASLKNAISASISAAPVYCWSASMAAGYEMLKALIDAGVHVQSQIVWIKNCIVLGQADYQWRHEPCWYGWTPGKNHYWDGGRTLSTVWAFSKDPNSAYEHPAQKPVSLSAHAISNSCRPGGFVLDLFGGSGSTLIGCETSGRACRMIEILPAYADVIVARWERFSGKQATLEGSGASFEQAKFGRRLEAEDALKEEVLAAQPAQ